jgi:hypothetical protein
MNLMEQAAREETPSAVPVVAVQVYFLPQVLQIQVLAVVVVAGVHRIPII